MRIRFVLGSAFLAGAAYFAVFGGEYSLLDVRRIVEETDRENQRLEALRTEVDQLDARADSLEDDSATIERLARERWGLIRPGERLYRFEDADSADGR